MNIKNLYSEYRKYIRCAVIYIFVMLLFSIAINGIAIILYEKFLFLVSTNVNDVHTSQAENSVFFISLFIYTAISVAVIILFRRLENKYPEKKFDFPCPIFAIFSLFFITVLNIWLLILADRHIEFVRIALSSTGDVGHSSLTAFGALAFLNIVFLNAIVFAVGRFVATDPVTESV